MRQFRFKDSVSIGNNYRSRALYQLKANIQTGVGQGTNVSPALFVVSWAWFTVAAGLKFIR